MEPKGKKKSPQSACEDLAEMLGIPEEDYEAFKETFQLAVAEMEDEEEY